MGKANLNTQHHLSSLTLKNKICRHKHIKICTVTECQKLLCLMEEIQENLNKWRDISCSWIRRFKRVTMSVLSKLIYRFKQFLIHSYLCIL